jgi:hypothetical protein
MIARLTKPLWLVNALLLAVGIFFGVSLIKDLTRSRPLPPSPASPRTQGSPASPDEAPTAQAGDNLETYNVIVAKYLFNPARSEGGQAAAAPTAPPPPKPNLLGVVVDGEASRAYVEEANTKRVFGYKIGDTVAGGRLDQITDEKIVIVRPDGAIDVLLRDPSKPRPPAPPAPGQPGAQPPGSPVRAGVQPVPGQPPVVPRALRRLPVEQHPQ